MTWENLDDVAYYLEGRVASAAASGFPIMSVRQYQATIAAARAIRELEDAIKEDAKL